MARESCPPPLVLWSLFPCFSVHIRKPQWHFHFWLKIKTIIVVPLRLKFIYQNFGALHCFSRLLPMLNSSLDTSLTYIINSSYTSSSVGTKVLDHQCCFTLPLQVSVQRQRLPHGCFAIPFVHNNLPNSSLVGSSTFIFTKFCVGIPSFTPILLDFASPCCYVALYRYNAFWSHPFHWYTLSLNPHLRPFPVRWYWRTFTGEV